MYHTLPHHAITNHAQPHRTITNHTPPHHAITNHTLPHHAITNHTLPHHAITNHTLPHHALPNHALQASPLWDGPGSVHNNGVGLCLHAQIKGAETHAKPNSIRSQQRDTDQAWYSSTQPSTFQCNHPFHCVSCSTNQGLIKKTFWFVPFQCCFCYLSTVFKQMNLIILPCKNCRSKRIQSTQMHKKK